MKLRCRCCGGKLGLGAHSIRVWVPERWWFERRYFCSAACRIRDLEELEDAVHKKAATSALHKSP
jgi:hypothetical protein